MIKKIGIIGGGISGLVTASKITSLYPYQNISITIFDKNHRLGGRAYSLNLQGNWADIGANIIDFENQQEEKSIWQSIFEPIKLQQLQYSFKIYENSSLTDPSFQKRRYCYKGGFKQLFIDLYDKFGDTIKVYNNTQVLSIEKLKDNQQWKIKYKNKEQEFQSSFEYLVIAMPPIMVPKIYNTEQIKDQFNKQNNNLKYTYQICAIFQMKNMSKNWSCILFKEHPITFFCSHIEKYLNNQIWLVAIQMNQQFSYKNWEIEESIIADYIYQLIPQILKQNIFKHCLAIKKWYPSLLIKTQGNKFINTKQMIDMKIWVTGDCLIGRSKVSNALIAGCQVATEIVQNLNFQKISKI